MDGDRGGADEPTTWSSPETEAPADEEKVILKPATGNEITLPMRVAKQSSTICDLLDACSGEADPVPLDNVSGLILEKVVDYCKMHADDSPIEDEEDYDAIAATMTPWDREFFNVDQGTLFEIILAANYLGLKVLLNNACKIVAEMIHGKTPEEIRKHFNIKNDFTPSEDDPIITENVWCDNP